MFCSRSAQRLGSAGGRGQGGLPGHASGATILHYTILYYAVLYCTVLCYSILYYTILYYAIGSARLRAQKMQRDSSSGGPSWARRGSEPEHAPPSTFRQVHWRAATVGAGTCERATGIEHRSRTVGSRWSGGQVGSRWSGIEMIRWHPEFILSTGDGCVREASVSHPPYAYITQIRHRLILSPTGT